MIDTGYAAELSLPNDSLDTEVKPLNLVPGQDVDNVAQHLYFLETPGSFDLTTIVNPENIFRRNNQDIFNPGVTRDVIWARLDVENMADRSGEWIFSLNRALLSNVGMFLFIDDDVRVLLDDSRESIISSYREYRTLAGRFTLPPHSSAQIYVRYQAANWAGLAPRLATEQSFRSRMLSDLAVYLLLLGGILTLVAIGSISFIFLGKQIVIYYALAQIAFFAFYTHFASISTVYLFPEQSDSLRFVSPLTMGLFIVFICQFSRYFFETSSKLPVINKVFLGLVGLCLLAFVLMIFSYAVPLISNQWPLVLLYLSLMSTWVILPGLAIYATWKWQIEYWPLIVAWTSTSVFMFIQQMTWLGLITSMPLEENIFGVFIYLEAAFLALAIALRVRVIREEALLTEQQLNASLRAELATTERAKRLYEEREWALQDLAEKGRLLLTAGHDTRQMISALRNYSAGIRMVSNEEKVKRATTNIDYIVENLNEVLTTIVEGSRSGGISDSILALDTFKPEKIINAMVLIHGASAREKNTDIHIHISTGPIVTDRILLGRVMSNFLSNAIKHTSNGRIILACRPFRGGYRFQVWDQGAGIAPDDLAKLLDPAIAALRLDSEAEGQGSGLSIVKALAARLGGSIAAHSTPGRGSLFEFFLPGISMPSVLTGGESPDCKIILADSDDEHADLFARSLSEFGIELERWSSSEFSSGGKDCLPRTASLIFIDEHFGGANQGIEYLRQVSKAHPGIAPVLLSYDRSIEARVNLAREAALILYKPVSAMAIKAAVAHLMSNASITPDA